MVQTKHAPAQGKSIHYTLNGTGRDGYIYDTHGGFMSSNSPTNPTNSFLNGLRSYQPSPGMTRSPSNSSLNKSNSFNRIDYFTEGQFIVPKR